MKNDMGSTARVDGLPGRYGDGEKWEPAGHCAGSNQPREREMMEQLTVTQAVNEISQALATLDNAKADCKDVVDATLDAYFGEIKAESREEFKEVKAARKIERKNILKLAKAMAKGEKDEVRDEAENMQMLVDSI